jgi:hypothetical protein
LKHLLVFRGANRTRAAVANPERRRNRDASLNRRSIQVIAAQRSSSRFRFFSHRTDVAVDARRASEVGLEAVVDAFRHSTTTVAGVCE